VPKEKLQGRKKSLEGPKEKEVEATRAGREGEGKELGGEWTGCLERERSRRCVQLEC